MIYSKKFIIGLLIIIGICGIAVAAVLINRPTTPDTSTETTQEPTVSSSVRIDNFSSYEDIDVTTKATVEESINRYISDIKPGTKAVGTIREGSYQKTTGEAGINIVFLVDFPDVQLSYKISIGRDSTTEEQSMYTLCPAANELIYPPFNCKDDLSETI